MTDDLTGNTRRVTVTHDGKPIGYTEPLEREWRGKPAKRSAKARANGLKAIKAMRDRGRKAGRISAMLQRARTLKDKA
jgi:hypothetical protein